MKKLKLILLYFLLILTVSCFAQEDIRKKQHIFIFDIALDECNFDGTAVATANSQIMEKDWRFTIRNIINNGNDYIILVSKFTGDPTEAIKQNSFTFQKTASTKNIYFKITSAQYLAFAEELKRRGSFVVGASTTLIKIRPGNGKDNKDEVIYSEFGNDFNIGLTAGWRITNYKRNTSVSLVGGIAFSSIKVTPQTTRDFIKSESTQSSITFSGGAIFEIDKFQISIFTGIDTMSGEIGKNWIYRNRPWLGLGFGYEIFKPKGPVENKT